MARRFRSLTVQRRALLALLVIVSLAYNPFMTVRSGTNSLSFHHPPSYRATLAASEFVKLKYPEQGIPLAELSVGDLIPVARLEIPLSTNTETTEDCNVVAAPELMFCASMWFRPPPAV